jgi:succinyl-CoA synthetase alpha subunit
MSDIAAIEKKLMDAQIACIMEAMATRVAYIKGRKHADDARSKRMAALGSGLNELLGAEVKDQEWLIVARARCIAALNEVGSEVTRKWADEMEKEVAANA